ncbi:Hint domain-containing protein [Paralysiella testudinis]|uniref:Hint domain-containing protein n=2 Tax=Paralysiella testudinis TaxID=2809020 RepID=A0A892ZJF4_9NEIS|nr:Hint domain-containing protein [Paralysiella testudinis]
MHRFIQTKATENMQSSTIGCFIKGTLVETQEGWTPIDELKVGDLVMARPENGIGEAVQKRVVNTFKFENKAVWLVEIGNPKLKRESGGARFAATPNHPVCVYGAVNNLFIQSRFGELGRVELEVDVERDDDWNEKFEALSEFVATPYTYTLYEQPLWKRVDQLERGDVVLDWQNNYRVVEMVRPLYAVPDNNAVWVQGYSDRYDWEQSAIGHIYDLTLSKDNDYTFQRAVALHVRNDEMLLAVDEQGQRTYQPYLTDVYNIEVEDYHTYCVTRSGILVYNTNCDKTQREGALG